MSDMVVREITETESIDAAPVEDKELNAVVEKMEADFKKMKASKKATTYTEGGIVFEGPSEAEQRKADKEKAGPLIDAAGRSRWIVTRECYCSPDSSDECRFHSTSERGWESCPNEHRSSGLTPRKLWATNPEFGKPRNVEEVLAETA